MGRRPTCLCGECRLCRKRAYRTAYARAWRRRHNGLPAEPHSIAQLAPVSLLRDERPPIQLTGEMRQALRVAIDQRRRERLREFAR
jgi:hypothetical protein